MVKAQGKAMTTPPAAFTNAGAGLPFPPPAWESWRRYGKIRRIPPTVLNELGRTLHGLIEVWSFGGVSAVASDGTVRVFVPSTVLWPKRGTAEPMAPLRAWLTSGTGDGAEQMVLQEITGAEGTR